jgi:hypothetical protein
VGHVVKPVRPGVALSREEYPPKFGREKVPRFSVDRKRLKKATATCRRATDRRVRFVHPRTGESGNGIEKEAFIRGFPLV